ncbi:MAG: hypothetical protein ACYTG7_06915 [Planctomycetota bacterium]|jgi:hypothetical protein
MFHKIAWLIILSALVAIPLSAQEKQPTAAPRMPPPLEQSIDVDFPGGTIPELLKTIEITNGIKPNVVVSEKASKVTLPAFTLRSVSLLEAIRALEGLREIGSLVLEVKNLNDVLIVSTVDVGPPPKKTPPRDIRVFDVSSILTEDCSIEDIVTTITTAWDMRSKTMAHDAELKYHPETKLLIAVGTREDLNLVHNVLVELLSAKERARKEIDLEKFEEELFMLRATKEELERRNLELKDENRQLMMMVKELNEALNKNK